MRILDVLSSGTKSTDNTFFMICSEDLFTFLFNRLEKFNFLVKGAISFFKGSPCSDKSTYDPKYEKTGNCERPTRYF